MYFQNFLTYKIFLSLFCYRVMSTESDSLDSLEKLSDANYELAINLFKLMSTENNNDFMSPISIFSALSIKIITIKKQTKIKLFESVFLPFFRYFI
jgi:serine protease inhibitor